ncbi:MAG TPA: FAD-dependent oxidoreductase, partial [Victivallales bacterium]|nr:FAD-dependent oxidoreductase [Victivallales bacterium]
MIRKVDVLVCGGGPAGFSAAFAASRMGARTLIVEQFNCLGGVATAGGHGHICLYSAWGTNERIVGGIIWEAAKKVEKAGYGVCNNSSADFEVEGMKLILEQMAEESNTDLLYHTFASEAIVKDNEIKGIVVYNKNGRQEIYADRIIDCTGDGDIAAMAGCSFDYGDEESGLCQPVTLMFTIGGVDWDKVVKFRQEYQNKFPDDSNPWKLERVYAEAIKNGDMRPFQTGNMGWWWTPTRPDQIGVNFTHVTNIDSRKAEDLTKATIEARKQAYETINVYRK